MAKVRELERRELKFVLQIDVPEKTEFHETKETFTLPINGIKAFRIEKLSGDGKIQDSKLLNETASIEFVSNGPTKLKVKCYVITQGDVDGNQIEEDVKDAMCESLIERKKDENGLGHDVFRPVEEVKSAALDHLKQKYSKELELLETK